MSEVVKLGFKLLQHWDVVKCDKDGGFAVSPRGTLLKVHLEILQSDTYTEINPCEINNDSLREQHFELCRMAEQCDNNPGLAWSLQKSACSTGNCIQSTLGLTCKPTNHVGWSSTGTCIAPQFIWPLVLVRGSHHN